MSRDKQIWEMAKDLGIAFQLAGTTRFGEVAEILVNAGYRKSTDVAKEVINDMRKMINGYENIDVYLDRIEKKYSGE